MALSLKKDIDWSGKSIEGAIEEALSMIGATDRNTNAVMTKGVAAVLVKMGHPGTVVDLGRAICEVATKGEVSGMQTGPDGGKRRLIGATWVGNGMHPDEPWNRHQWALPMWQKINLQVAL